MLQAPDQSSLREDSPSLAMNLDELTGGNPKVMFLTYKVDARRKAVGRALLKAEVQCVR